MFQSSGNLLSLSTINSITNYFSKGIVNDAEFDGVFEGRSNDTNCTEYMMKFCNGKKYNFMLLLNDPFICTGPISDVFFPGSRNRLVSYPIEDFSREEMDSLMTNVRVGRAAQNMNDHQKYMMCFAWVIPNELQMFESFPYVIMVDTVEKTNNEKRPLLTVGGKDSNGKMFIFLRCFMPNQLSWMFRWIFSVVMPSLIDKKLLEHVRIIIFDGDT